MSTIYPEKQSDKQDAQEVKNYTRTPNMLIFGYPNVSPQEKWLYTCLKHLCGKKGTRHLSLRYISEQTGISVGALSVSKDKSGKVNEGMIRHLHNAGLIHSEIKKHEGKGNAQYHITITDVWALNQEFFRNRSDFGQDEGNPSEIRTDDTQTRPKSEQACPKSEQACPNSSTILRLESNITNNITEQDCSSDETTSPPTCSEQSSSLPHTPSQEKAQNDISAHSYSRDAQQQKRETIRTEKAQEVQKPPTRRSVKKKSKAVDIALQARIDTVYAFFDQLKALITENPNARYRRTERDTEAIIDWLEDGHRTQEMLRKVYLEMWNTPPEPGSTFSWKKNMWIHSVLKQYDTLEMDIGDRERQQAGRHVGSGVFVPPPEEQEDEMVFILPSMRREQRGKAVAAQH